MLLSPSDTFQIVPRRSPDLTPTIVAFPSERHLATLTTRVSTALPYVAAIAFEFNPSGGDTLIIPTDGTQKVRDVERTGRAVGCQGRRPGSPSHARKPSGVTPTASPPLWLHRRIATDPPAPTPNV